MNRLEPLEMLLPGTWEVTLPSSKQNASGNGIYTFKIAGTFNAKVTDVYSGEITWHGYWQITNAYLILQMQEITPWCTSCIDGGITQWWKIELEQVGETRFTGTIITDGDANQQTIMFTRKPTELAELDS